MDRRTDGRAQTNMPPNLLRSWGHKKTGKERRPLRWDTTEGYFYTSITRTIYQWESLQKDSNSHWKIRLGPDHSQYTKAGLVAPQGLISKDDSTMHRKRGRQNRCEDNIKAWTGAQLGQLKTKQSGKGFLRSHLWWPNNLALLRNLMCRPVI